jgi:hypothetical protein
LFFLSFPASAGDESERMGEDMINFLGYRPFINDFSISSPFNPIFHANSFFFHSPLAHPHRSGKLDVTSHGHVPVSSKL